MDRRYRRRIKTKYTALLAIILLSIGACVQKNSELLGSSIAVMQQSIINGEQCLPNEHESAVELFIDAEISFGDLGVFQVSSPFCGGTLIAPDVVLTAAHCLDPTELTYGFGTITRIDYYVTREKDLNYFRKSEGRSFPEHAVKASSWIIEEGYDSQAMDGPGPHNFHDIGLVFLSTPLTIKPAVVITKEEATQIGEGRSVTIAGWGQRTPDSLVLTDASQGLDGQKYCATAIINEAGIHEMQVGSNEESSRKCFGDSGGPTYMDVMTPDGLQNRVIGITSHAYDDSVCKKGGLDTRVDAWLDWIDAKMRAGCASKERSWCEVEGIILPEYLDEPSSLTAQLSAFVRQFFAYLLSWRS